MNMKICYLILCVVIFYSCSFTPTSKTVDIGSMDVYRVRNEQLLQILDSIIVYEMKYLSYHPDLLFYIKPISDSVYTIGPNSGRPVYKVGKNHGCIRYNGHIFLLEGMAPDSAVIKKTDEKIPFVYSVAPKRREQRFPKYLLISNDFADRWWYIYKDGEFRFWAGTLEFGE
jgi:hypothetical protein